MPLREASIEFHFKWERLSYYWSNSLNFWGPWCCADSQRASATQREKSCTKAHKCFRFLMRLRGLAGNVNPRIAFSPLYQGSLWACLEPGWVAANCCWGNVRRQDRDGSNNCPPSVTSPLVGIFIDELLLISWIEWDNHEVTSHGVNTIVIKLLSLSDGYGV